MLSSYKFFKEKCSHRTGTFSKELLSENMGFCSIGIGKNVSASGTYSRSCGISDPESTFDASGLFSECFGTCRTKSSMLSSGERSSISALCYENSTINCNGKLSIIKAICSNGSEIIEEGELNFITSICRDNSKLECKNSLNNLKVQVLNSGQLISEGQLTNIKGKIDGGYLLSKGNGNTENVFIKQFGSVDIESENSDIFINVSGTREKRGYLKTSGKNGQIKVDIHEGSVLNKGDFSIVDATVKHGGNIEIEGNRNNFSGHSSTPNSTIKISANGSFVRGTKLENYSSYSILLGSGGKLEEGLPKIALASGTKKETSERGISAKMETYARGKNPIGGFSGNYLHCKESGYKEYFQWEDNNIGNEDRVGLFVTLNNGKLVIAQNSEEAIGVVSNTNGLVGDTHNIQEVDQFGNILVKYDYTYPLNLILSSDKHVLEINDISTKEQLLEKYKNHELYEKISKINPVLITTSEGSDTSVEYLDKTQDNTYTPITLLGKVKVRYDSKTKKLGNKVSVENGVAIDGNDYFVTSKISNKVIEILFK